MQIAKTSHFYSPEIAPVIRILTMAHMIHVRPRF